MVKKVWYILILLSLVLAACGGGDDSKNESSSADQAADAAGQYAGKKIAWLDSYHEGYAWSDGIQAGIESVLNGTGIELKIFRLDTKHVLDTAEREAAGARVHEEIDAFGPDVIIASDDDAQTFVIVPYYKDTDTPVLFVGVNNDAAPYGYPTANVTGMIEVDLADQAVEQMRQYMKGARIGFLSDDTTTSHRMADSYTARFPMMQDIRFTNSYQEFKEMFRSMQGSVNLLIVHNTSGIADWDAEDAQAFVLETTQIPTVGVHDFMAPYLLVVFGLVADEEGIWAAESALKILDGTPVSEIPVVESQQGNVYVNLAIADKLDLALPPSLLRNAFIVGEQAAE